ncbi:hypothetical protein PS2_023037 [Malus domestica]
MSQSPWNVSGNIGKEDGGMLASDEVGNLHEVDKKVGKIMQRVYLGPVPGEVGKLDAAFAMSEKAGNEFNVDVESVSSEHPMSDQSGRSDDDLVIHDDSSCLIGDKLQHICPISFGACSRNLPIRFDPPEHRQALL